MGEGICASRRRRRRFRCRDQHGEMGHRRSDRPRRPPRIVHVTHIDGQPDASEDDFRLDVQYAESSLRAATAAVEATGKPVKIETEILWGSPDTALINESRNASMVCVGSIGIGAIAGKMWGPTAASLAENAYRPVAIIRSPHNVPASEPDWIVAAVQGTPMMSRSSNTQ